jgi:hypothetical protein
MSKLPQSSRQWKGLVVNMVRAWLLITLSATISTSSRLKPVQQKHAQHTEEVLVSGMAECKTGGTVSATEVACSISIPQSDENLNQGEENTGYPTSSFLQFYILLKRTFLSTMSDQTLTQMRFLTHIVVGLVTGMTCFEIGNE